MFIESSKIGVYPSAVRGQNASYSESRISTESNTARLISNVIDTDGFVITDIATWNELSTDLKRSTPITFNIYGYTFTILNPGTIFDNFSAAGSIYAVIALQQTPNSKETLEQYELYGQDEAGTGNTSYYKGLQLNNTSNYSWDVEPAFTYFTKHLLLFSSADGVNWQVPKESYMRLTSDALKLDIDCGEIV